MKAPVRDRLGEPLAALAALAAWVAGLPDQFVQDDRPLLVQNLRVHALANWREILSSPFWPPPYSQDLYRPLTALLLALQWALGGGNPLVFRIVSGVLYAGVAVAVLRLARALLPLWLAVGVALLFAAHPVHVEAEALAAGQSELLVGLLCCVAVLRYLTRRRSGELQPRDWLVVGGCYLAACLFKEQGLMLPGLLAAAELVLIRDAQPGRVRRLLPGYLLLLGLAALVLLARVTALSGNLVGSFTADALTGLSLPQRALTMLRVVPQWARLLLWPAHLQADYSPQELVASTGFGALEALGLLLLLGVALSAWLARRHAPVLSFGLCWTAIALFPVSNVLVPTGILLAERTLLLPSIGLLLALGAALELLGALPAAPRLRRPVAVGSAILLGLAVLAGLLRSVERQGAWRDETRFRLRSAADAPRSWRTQLSSGTALFLDWLKAAKTAA